MAHFDETLLDEFVDFFEWIYAVNIPQDSRDELFDYVSRYWDDEDTSEQELVESATDQYSQVVQELRNAESSRQLLHKHFRREFRSAIARLDGEAPATDRDNILRFLGRRHCQGESGRDRPTAGHGGTRRNESRAGYERNIRRQGSAA